MLVGWWLSRKICKTFIPGLEHSETAESPVRTDVPPGTSKMSRGLLHFFSSDRTTFMCYEGMSSIL